MNQVSLDNPLPNPLCLEARTVAGTRLCRAEDIGKQQFLAFEQFCQKMKDLSDLDAILVHFRMKIEPKRFQDAPKSAQGIDQEPPEKRPRGIWEPPCAQMF